LFLLPAALVVLILGHAMRLAMQSMAERFTRLEDSNNLKPALVNIEEGWQIGYQIEVLDGGWVAVFLP